MAILPFIQSEDPMKNPLAPPGASVNTSGGLTALGAHIEAWNTLDQATSCSDLGTEMAHDEPRYTYIYLLYLLPQVSKPNLHEFLFQFASELLIFDHHWVYHNEEYPKISPPMPRKPSARPHELGKSPASLIVHHGDLADLWRTAGLKKYGGNPCWLFISWDLTNATEYLMGSVVDLW